MGPLTAALPGEHRSWRVGLPGGFDAALAGTVHQLQLADGRTLPLATRRWRAMASRADHWMLDRCHGPTIDLGCGPGRLVAALHARGVPTLGVDSSTLAMRHCASRRAPAVRRDVFGPLPGEGSWGHVLLADGNIGIGGDPAALLRRAASLLRPGGTVLVELAPAGDLWRGEARLRGGRRDAGPWFPWAVVGPGAVRHLAQRAGLLVTDLLTRRRRCFAQLRTDQPGARISTTPSKGCDDSKRTTVATSSRHGAADGRDRLSRNGAAGPVAR